LLLIEHYVAPSSIHGLGVFAANFVPKGTKVWVFHPAIDRLIPVSELTGLPEHVLERIEIHAEYLPHLNAFRLGADGDLFMNHCDDPNLVDRGDEMFASRDIQAGEELHYNYRQTVIIAFDPDTRTRNQTQASKST
jgi:uncharacterized protein